MSWLHTQYHRYLAWCGYRVCDDCHCLTSNQWRPIQFSLPKDGGSTHGRVPPGARSFADGRRDRAQRQVSQFGESAAGSTSIETDYPNHKRT